jgi:hypothetical protein
MSILMARRSRSPALALARVSGPTLDRTVDPTPDRARIEVSCLHKLLGIAPQKLLFHASVKNDPILSSLTSSRIQSAGLPIIEVVRVKRMLIAGPGDSASVIDLPPHRQNTMTPSAIRSPTVRKAGC